MKTHKLYVCDGYKEISDNIMYDALTDRTLILACRAPYGFRLMTEDERKSMTVFEKRWYVSQVNALNCSALKKHEKEYAQFLNKFCDFLEAELKKHKAEAEDNNAGND